MSTIKELYDKAICKAEFSPEPSLAFAEGFELGANTVLDIVGTYIQNLDLGSSAEEKFYKLDVIADIGLFIKQLGVK